MVHLRGCWSWAWARLVHLVNVAGRNNTCFSLQSKEIVKLQSALHFGDNVEYGEVIEKETLAIMPAEIDWVKQNKVSFIFLRDFFWLATIFDDKSNIFSYENQWLNMLCTTIWGYIEHVTVFLHILPNFRFEMNGTRAEMCELRDISSPNWGFSWLSDTNSKTIRLLVFFPII